MKTPKAISRETKLFGDNRFNLYGWVIAGLFVMGGSLWYVVRALRAGGPQSSNSLILLAIYFVLLGHFGLALQTYCARVAKSLDAASCETDGTSEA